MAPHFDDGVVSSAPLVPDGEVPLTAPRGPLFAAPKASPVNGTSDQLNSGETPEAEQDYGHSTASVPLNPESAYKPRKLRIVTIGAGFSGLLIAHKFQHRFPELRDLVDHTIYEERSDLGGTW